MPPLPPDKKAKIEEEPPKPATHKAVEKDPSDVISPKPKVKEPYVVPMTDVAAKVEVPKGDTEADKVQAQMTEILKRYNMCESDIPMPHGNHPDSIYWDLRNRLQGMRNS